MNALLVKAAEPARWLIVVGIAYTLATTALTFFAPPQADAPSASATQADADAAAPRNRAGDVNLVLQRHLFGRAGAQPREVVQRPAVETRLPLELQGVFVAEDPAESAAIVAQKGKPGVLYAVNDQIPGNATLVEVHSDHIVLRRAGNREQLKFPDAKAQFVPDAEGPSQPQRQPRAGPGGRFPAASVDEEFDEEMLLDEEFLAADPFPEDLDQPSAAELVSSYQELIDTDPEGALAELGIAPVEDGAASGYRLGNLASSPYLAQTGLQPGDVILSVNGRPVGDIRQDQMELQSVLAEGSARLEVQRGNRRFFVTASLK